MPRLRLTLAAALLFAAPLAATAEPFDAAAHYAGTWLEVAHTPFSFTKNCVAGTTTYSRVDATHIDVVDDCRKGGVDGERKVIKGRGVIEDPGVDHRLRVSYLPLVTWRFNVVDHDSAGAWFIATDPTLKKAYVFTRKPPSPAMLDELIGKARKAGYAGKFDTPPTR
jgi:apolipoprotein D and lipocalin family protein